jgi:hypothetical protein
MEPTRMQANVGRQRSGLAACSGPLEDTVTGGDHAVTAAAPWARAIWAWRRHAHSFRAPAAGLQLVDYQS